MDKENLFTRKFYELKLPDQIGYIYLFPGTTKNFRKDDEIHSYTQYNRLTCVMSSDTALLLHDSFGHSFLKIKNKKNCKEISRELFFRKCVETVFDVNFSFSDEKTKDFIKNLKTI